MSTATTHIHEPNYTEDEAIKTTQEGEHDGLKNEVTITSLEEFTMSTATTHTEEQQHVENKMSDNLTINNTFVYVYTSIAVAENTVALSSLPPVLTTRTSTRVSDASDDEVRLSKLIPKGFKIKKNIKSQKDGTNNKHITREIVKWCLIVFLFRSLYLKYS